MNSLKSILHLHAKDWFYWLLAPWVMIVLPSFTVNMIISLFARTDTGIYTGGLAGIFIYMLIVGIILVSRTFPFVLGFGRRRVDYFVGTALVAFAVCLIEALVVLLLSVIEYYLTNGWFLRLHFFHLPFLNDGSLLAQGWIYFISMVFLFFLGFTIACLYQRTGRNGMLIGGGLALLLGTIGSYICTYYGLWFNVFTWMVDQKAVGLASWLLLPVALCLPASYLLLRKATI
ncbi:hypothetical protein [Ktedonospora formicarum]|uniref:Uncharacterized protein n=1 Tax=Ktedonospora formicarum TaxID=2778364 RepID=A0A8J3MVS9_9CHLR|nr:hypothetical protein [Ktedonospora formicarum]GHO47968.1 hypothetical protein KSX_61310 [Ktedonospora formicarum]